jgi:hypothetical protein
MPSRRSIISVKIIERDGIGVIEIMVISPGLIQNERGVMDDEIIVADIFKTEFGITLKRILVGALKTPDFYGLHEGKNVFVAEVKSFKSLSPSEETGYERMPTGMWGKKSSEASKISEKIDEAYKQLKNYDLPKVLIFFNREALLRIDDLDNAFYSYQSDVPDFSADSICRDYSSAPASGKDIVKKEYRVIDLHIWIDWEITECDAETSQICDRHNQKWFCYTGPHGKELWMTYFQKSSH